MGTSGAVTPAGGGPAAVPAACPGQGQAARPGRSLLCSSAATLGTADEPSDIIRVQLEASILALKMPLSWQSSVFIIMLSVMCKSTFLF